MGDQVETNAQLIDTESGAHVWAVRFETNRRNLVEAQSDIIGRLARTLNLELMAACTHEGLLYGGPDYFAHGDLPCIHHTFTHAKALATVLDRGGANLVSTERVMLPRAEVRLSLR